MFKSATRAIRISLRRFVRGEFGTTAIEYALIASGISVAIAATVMALGSNIQNYYNSVADAMK